MSKRREGLMMRNSRSHATRPCITFLSLLDIGGGWAHWPQTTLASYISEVEGFVERRSQGSEGKFPQRRALNFKQAWMLGPARSFHGRYFNQATRCWTAVWPRIMNTLMLNKRFQRYCLPMNMTKKKMRYMLCERDSQLGERQGRIRKNGSPSGTCVNNFA